MGQRDQIDDATINSRVLNICLATGGLYAYQLIVNPAIFDLIANDLFKNFYSFLFYFINYILLPPSLFLFLKRYKSGWILMATYLVYMIVSGLTSFIEQLLYFSSEKISSTYIIFQAYDLITPSIIFGVILSYVCKPLVTIYYCIPNVLLYTIITIVTIATIIFQLYVK